MTTMTTDELMALDTHAVRYELDKMLAGYKADGYNTNEAGRRVANEISYWKQNGGLPIHNMQGKRIAVADLTDARPSRLAEQAITRYRQSLHR